MAGGKFGDDVVRGNEKNCVKLRGLPYSASAEDVIAFFDEYGSDIAPHGIHMVLNAVVGPSLIVCIIIKLKCMVFVLYVENMLRNQCRIFSFIVSV